MNDKEPIREFDFFRSFEKPKNINDIKKPNKIKEKIKDSTKVIIENATTTLEELKKEAQSVKVKQNTKAADEGFLKHSKKLLAIALLGCSVLYLYHDAFTKMDEVYTILSAESTRIDKSIADFTVRSPINTFVVKNFNECSNNMKGIKKDIANQCELYVLNLVETTDKETNVDKKAVSQSLEEFNKLSQISPEADLKTEKIANDIKLIKIMKLFFGE